MFIARVDPNGNVQWVLPFGKSEITFVALNENKIPNQINPLVYEKAVPVGEVKLLLDSHEAGISQWITRGTGKYHTRFKARRCHF